MDYKEGRTNKVSFECGDTNANFQFEFLQLDIVSRLVFIPVNLI